MKTVYVGMSGGVDSSVTAALLKSRGFNVVGVFMKNWTKDLPGMPCPWKEDYQDAKRVAVQLDIDFKVYDFQKQYHHLVVDYMINEYKLGLTPNPDIMCNQEIKFRLFLQTALSDGADLIATGHYARVLNEYSQQPNNPKQPAQLITALNLQKDQTYFLYRLSEQALSKSLMPIGDFKTKQEVRAIATKLGLATANKKDSQGICFVGKVGIKDFLSQYVKTQPGSILDPMGKIVGSHDGAIFYTIGQRHGLDVGGGLPYYVIGKNMHKNEVYVTNDLDDKLLWNDNLHLTNIHWINSKPKSNSVLQVRTRYRAPLIMVKKIIDNPTGVTLKLDEKVRAITPGQSAVLYNGNLVVGGGIVT